MYVATSCGVLRVDWSSPGNALRRRLVAIGPGLKICTFNGVPLISFAYDFTRTSSAAFEAA